MIAEVVASGLYFRAVEAELHRVAVLSAELIRKTADEFACFRRVLQFVTDASAGGLLRKKGVVSRV